MAARGLVLKVRWVGLSLTLLHPYVIFITKNTVCFWETALFLKSQEDRVPRVVMDTWALSDSAMWPWPQLYSPHGGLLQLGTQQYVGEEEDVPQLP